MSANCGDSRVLMIKDGQPPEQLSVDHVPDLESERQRIEDQKARNSKCVRSWSRLVASTFNARRACATLSTHTIHRR
jgi:serine/threonine protein phosphatase PrpC